RVRRKPFDPEQAMSLASFKEARRKAARHPLAKALLHPAITLAGLLMLLLQVFFGTLYQADHGLYEAQRVFFGYVIWVRDILPFPGASLVLWVLTLQLLLMKIGRASCRERVWVTGDAE